MTGYRLEDVLGSGNLFAAWSRVRENDGCAGVDRQTILDFDLDLEPNLGDLRLEVLAGTYRPHPLLRVWIEKDSGGNRPLAIPAVRDRLLQTAVALVVTPLFEAEFEDCSFAYRKGRSVEQAVHQVIRLRDEGFQWVVDCDIQQFFDEIDHKILMDEVEKLIKDPGILHLIRLWLTTEVDDDGIRLPTIRGVPQGSPLSPLLSNLYLDHLDEALLGNNLRLVRFADDFLVLCKSRDRAEDALELTETTLGELRLRINVDKTRIVDFNAGFRFLGIQFIRSLAFKYYEDDTDESPETAQPFQPAIRPSATTVCSGTVVLKSTETDGQEKIVVPLTQTALSLPAPLPPAECAAAFPGTGEEDLPCDGDPRLRTLYLLEHGMVVGKESERFVVRKNGKIVQEIPAIKVDQIMVFGNCQLTTQVMNFCLLENIPIYLLSGQGRFYGVVDSFSTDPVLLHRDQFARAADSDFCLKLAREIIRGKIANSRVILLRVARRRDAAVLRDAVAALKAVIGKLDSAATLDQLRGFEGIAARTYFSAISSTLDSEWRFGGRVRRPPTDPVNAMFSYGYTLLFYNIYSFLRARGLNPHVGYLHPLRSGHPALVSDMIEEFRAVLVDAVVFNLVLNRKLVPTDFTFPDTANRPCYMNNDARATFIRSFETKLNASVTHPISGLHLDYRRCIEHQVQELAAVIRGRQGRYRPMVLR